MKNIILAIPVNTELTPDQEATIASFKSQWVNMPATRVFNDKYLVDAIVNDNFSETALPADWDILYKATPKSVVTPLSPTYLDFMADINTYDEEGVVTSTTRPTEMVKSHKYGGWL